MSYLVLGLILLTVTLSAFAQLSLKLGVAKLQMVNAFQSGVIEIVSAAAISPFIWIGLIIYGLGVVLWLWVLSKVDLSAAYPFVGVSFLITMAFGFFFLDEHITPMRIVGTILIVSGCILVAKSA